MFHSKWFYTPLFASIDGPTPGVLFEVDVPIMSNSECHDMFKKAGHEKRILDSFVCAGYAEGKKDSCEVTSVTVTQQTTCAETNKPISTG